MSRFRLYFYIVFMEKNFEQGVKSLVLGGVEHESAESKKRSEGNGKY